MKFETERIIVRKPIKDDAKDIFKNYTQDKDVTKYLIWEPHRNLKDTEDWIDLCIDEWDENKMLPFIIWDKESKEAIGMVDFRIQDFKVSIGYVLTKGFWGRGVMTEATKPILDMLLKRENIYRVEALHDIENPASGGVMVKLGMKLEGTLYKYSMHPNISKKKPRDCKIYSITKDS